MNHEIFLWLQELTKKQEELEKKVNEIYNTVFESSEEEDDDDEQIDSNEFLGNKVINNDESRLNKFDKRIEIKKPNNDNRNYATK